MTDEKEHSENLEAGGFGAKVSIPQWVGAYIGPYLKWFVIAISAGFFVVLVCYGLRLVIK